MRNEHFSFNRHIKYFGSAHCRFKEYGIWLDYTTREICHYCKRDRNVASTAGNPRPAVRMVCTYYEDSVFYVSTDAKKSKMLQIEKNNEVSICGLGWYACQGTAENPGWVKDEKNVEIRAEFKKNFDWFDEVGDEENPDSIVLRISLTEGIIIDNEKKYGEYQYEIDFINKTAK